MAWLSFIELDKAVWSMWSDWLVFCDYGFSAFALWCPLATPTVLLGFLLPWAWGISSRLLQQSTAIAPYLGQGVSPHHRPSWPWTCSSSSRPSCFRAATASWTCGCSSQPYDYTVEVRNRFKGLDLIECLMNYGRRFMTFYRRQGSRPSPWKRNAKSKMAVLEREALQIAVKRKEVKN